MGRFDCIFNVSYSDLVNSEICIISFYGCTCLTLKCVNKL